MLINTLLSLPLFVSLVIWIGLTFLHGQFWKLKTDETPAPAPTTWPDVTIVVPARNEADILGDTLPSLLKQDYPGIWDILLIDDNSDDGTADKASSVAEAVGNKHRLKILRAPVHADGWAGKVAAMQAGVVASSSSYILFTDADIHHAPDSLRHLMAETVRDQIDLNSRMVKLHCTFDVEKLLVPAFVFFFMMLYPFRLIEKVSSRIAGAAGGVMLVRRTALMNAGGLVTIREALIDDCSLAYQIKNHGGDHSAMGHVNLSLTNRIFSLRPYPTLASLWDMVARTAFTQLRYSPLLLLGTVLGLLTLFVVPLYAAVTGLFWASLTGMALWGLMGFLYWPIVRYYGLPWIWCFTLPLAACLYLGMTLDSARRYWQGKGGMWKKRVQALKK